MSIYTIERRIDRLNTDRLINSRRLIAMRCEPNEPHAAAISRWCAAHPGEPPPYENDNVIFIVRTLVAP